MEREKKFVDEIYRKKVGSISKKERVWNKLKWKEVQTERDKGNTC